MISNKRGVNQFTTDHTWSLDKHCKSCGKFISARPLDSCSEQKHLSRYIKKLGRKDLCLPKKQWSHHGVCLSCGLSKDKKPINCSSSEHLGSYNLRLDENKQWRKVHKKYNRSRIQRWNQTSSGKASHHRSNARRRQYPTSIILNTWFKDSHLHHLTEDMACYIPSVLHESISHSLIGWKNMDNINAKVLEFLDESR